MAEHSYHKEQSKKKIEQADRLISDMPSFARSFFVRMKNNNRSAGTILGYAQDLHVFFMYLDNSAGFSAEGIKKQHVEMLDLLTVDDLDEFLSDIGYGENGRARMTSTLRSFFTHFNRRKDIKTNPAALLDKPKIKEKEIITLELNEVAQILNAVKTEDVPGKPLTKRRMKTISRDLAILTVLLGTGIRVSELVGLDIPDVDMQNMCLHIIRKGGNEDRVYFGEEIKSAIEDYWSEDRDSLDPDDTAKDALFVSYAHKRLSVRSVENLVKRYSEKAALGKKITPHKMRSTFGTHLYQETGDIYLVASALGHSSVETSQRRYAKQAEKNKMRAAAASSTLFTDGRKEEDENY